MSDAPITPKFQHDAPIIMAQIISALPYNLSDEDAAAVLGNMGTETGGFSLRLEAGKEKANQGYGWCQWTGYDPDASDRRLLFEEWCKDNDFHIVVNYPADSPEEDYASACFGFFIHESVNTWEKRVFVDGGMIGGVFYPPLKDCDTLDDKVISFMKLYERPGTPHEDWRKEMAHEALRLYRGDSPIIEEPIMLYDRIVISSGHGLYVRGAHGIIDEVDEARKVVDHLSDALNKRGVQVEVFHDDISKSQSENLDRIVDYHNDQERDLDISVHFNAFEQTDAPRGVEVLYVTQAELAGELSAIIAEAGGFINRGGKYNGGLAFLNGTDKPSVLLEGCFVDSEADCDLYEENFEEIIEAIATILGGPLDEEEVPERPVRPERPDRPQRPPGFPIPRVDIEVSGEVLIFVNGEQIGTKG
jgi:N-acetylmuramoyl-L-alanine amidase